MSHFTRMKTCFQNLFYLEKALTRLNICYKRDRKTDSGLSNINLTLPQLNGYNVKFTWNKEEYELVFDLSFWKQDYSIETFTDRIAQQYASEVVVGESQKIGFQPVKYFQNSDGSTTLILERWSSNN